MRRPCFFPGIHRARECSVEPTIIIFSALAAISAVVCVGANFWLIVVGFRVHFFWGITLLFCPPLPHLIFTVLRWNVASKPVMLGVISAILSCGMLVPVYISKKDEIRQLVQTKVNEAKLRKNANLNAQKGNAPLPWDVPNAHQADPTPPPPPPIPKTLEGINDRLAALKLQEASIRERMKRLDKAKDPYGARVISVEIAGYNNELLALNLAKKSLENAKGVVSAPVNPARAKSIAPESASTTGTIAGRTFTVETASFKDGTLTLRQGSDYIPDLQVVVVLFGNDRSWNEFTFDSERPGNRTAHVHVHWTSDAGDPDMKVFTSGYQLKISLGPIEDQAISGRIDVVVPDGKNRHSIKGTFVAQVEK